MNFKFILPVLLFLPGCVYISTPSSGKKIGRIVKLSQEGFIWKTWEGELIRGGLSDGSGVVGSSFHFTIESANMAAIALDAFNNQFDVIMDYKTELISSMTRSEKWEPHFVELITPIR